MYIWSASLNRHALWGLMFAQLARLFGQASLLAKPTYSPTALGGCIGRVSPGEGLGLQSAQRSLFFLLFGTPGSKPPTTLQAKSEGWLGHRAANEA